jgi:hypothetical protein
MSTNALEIRRLNPVTDRLLYDTAFDWLDQSPDWRKDMEAVFAAATYDRYIAAIYDAGRVDVGVFVDRQLTAIVIFTIRSKFTYEVHLEADPKANAVEVTKAGCLIRDQIFNIHNARLVYAWVPSFNRPVKRILEAIGFRADHVTMLHGTCRGKLIEWVQFSMRANDEQQKAADSTTDAEPEYGLQYY